MRSFAIEEPGSPVPALYATLDNTKILVKKIIHFTKIQNIHSIKIFIFLKSRIFIQTKYSFFSNPEYSFKQNIHFSKIQNIHSNKIFIFLKRAVSNRAIRRRC